MRINTEPDIPAPHKKPLAYGKQEANFKSGIPFTCGNNGDDCGWSKISREGNKIYPLWDKYGPEQKAKLEI